MSLAHSSRPSSTRRKPRRPALAGLAVAAMALAGSACGNGDSGEDDGDLSVAIFVPEADMFAEEFRRWSAEVEEATDGRVSFEPFYGGSLTTITNAYEAVESGTADVALLAATALSNRFPDLEFMEGTGYFTGSLSPDEFTQTYDEVVGPLAEILSDVKLLSWGPGSINPTFVDREKLLVEPEDFEGRIVRTAGKLQGEQMAALGGSPTAVDPSELQVALQTGTVDSALFTPTLIQSSSLHETAPYLARMSDTATNTIMWVMNDDAWSDISADDQKAIEEILHEAGTGMPSFFAEREESAWEELEGAAETAVLDESQQEAVLAEMRPVLVDAAESGASASDAGKQLASIFSLLGE